MRFEVPENLNDLSLRDIFQQLKIPKKDLHHLNMSKDITINDKPARLVDKVHTDDDIFVPTIDEKSNYVPSYRYAQIKYEGDDMAIVTKPKGIKTHPNDLKESNTLMNHVIYTVDSDYVEPIHRLNQETIGLLIVAKNPLMKEIPDHMLEDNDITRIYRTDIKVLLPLKPQTIDMPIGKGKFHSNGRRVSPTGQRAITHILISKMIKETVCQLEIKLDTGRTRQIRVYLAEIGHPVIDDPSYGDSMLRQLKLESYKIEFVHPLIKEIISISLDD